jgi:pantoate--beta-alanine ligase
VAVGFAYWRRDHRPALYTGVVEGEERIIRSEVSGRVLAVEFAEGDSVPPGAVIARLDDTDIAARLRSKEQSLAVLGAEIRRQQEQVTTLESTWQQDVNARRADVRVGLVPTMGYLHAGHISLVKRARKLVGPRGIVVVSIYVNPTQFGPKEDFSRYPRDFARDRKLCQQEGVDVIFAPSDREMYPGRQGREELNRLEDQTGRGGRSGFSTYVIEDQLSHGMEGASRPGHFRGVATVVAKLFNIVQPQFAVFGAKDFQQAAIIQRMVLDLNFLLKIVVAPTLREADGLAMSSRNKYLAGPLREQATVLSRAIAKARSEVRTAGKPIAAAKLKRDLKAFIEREPDARVDYVEFFEPETLEPVAKVSRGAHMAMAVFVGKTRLIDNGGI